MRCDPDNRLVADSLEAEWNQALRNQIAAQEHYDKQRESETGLDDQQRAAILALAKDFPRLWNDPHTVSAVSRFDVPMFTYGDGCDGYASRIKCCPIIDESRARAGRRREPGALPQTPHSP
jgi:hypothetical protein